MGEGVWIVMGFGGRVAILYNGKKEGREMVAIIS